MTILHTALNKMPKRFSSNEFCNYAENHGFSKRRIRNGDIATFLHEHCNQITRRIWEKKEQNINNNETMKDQDYINYLKNKGYRIYKQIEL